MTTTTSQTAIAQLRDLIPPELEGPAESILIALEEAEQGERCQLRDLLAGALGPKRLEALMVELDYVRADT